MRRLIGIICLSLCVIPGARALDVGVGAKVGVNGVGIDLGVGLTENINLRLSVARLDVEDAEETVSVGDSGSEGDLDLAVDFDYGANALLLDWHVFGGGFRVTAGAFKNNGAAEGTGTLQDPIVIDGEDLSPNDFGTLESEVNLGDSYQPYIGVGWGRIAGADGGFSFALDVGVAMTDITVDYSAEVNSGGDNNLTQEELDQRLDALARDTEDELDEFDYWPVVALGINYAF